MSNSFDALYNAAPFANRNNTAVDNKTAGIGPEVILFKAAGLTRDTVSTAQRIAGLSVVMEIQKLEEAFDVPCDVDSSEAIGNIIKGLLLGIVDSGERPTANSVLSMLNTELLRLEPAIMTDTIAVLQGADNIKRNVVDLFSEIDSHLDLIFTSTPSADDNPLGLVKESSEIDVLRSEMTDLKSVVKKLQLAAKRS